MPFRRIAGPLIVFLAFAVLSAVSPGPTHAQSQGQLLPTGMRITPLAPTGTTLQSLNPGLPAIPDFLVDMTVTTALSPDGKTLLILTSGFNQNLDANGNVDPSSSNEYVFVFDVSGQAPRQAQVIQIVTNAFDGLAWNPISLGTSSRPHPAACQAQLAWPDARALFTEAGSAA